MEQDWIQQNPRLFYIIFPVSLVLVLAVCSYLLWRGPQRSLLICGKRRAYRVSGSGGNAVPASSLESGWGERAKMAGPAEKYRSEARASGCTAKGKLTKPPPPPPPAHGQMAAFRSGGITAVFPAAKYAARPLLPQQTLEPRSILRPTGSTDSVALSTSSSFGHSPSHHARSPSTPSLTSASSTASSLRPPPLLYHSSHRSPGDATSSAYPIDMSLQPPLSAFIPYPGSGHSSSYSTDSLRSIEGAPLPHDAGMGFSSQADWHGQASPLAVSSYHAIPSPAFGPGIDFSKPSNQQCAEALGAFPGGRTRPTLYSEASMYSQLSSPYPGSHITGQPTPTAPALALVVPSASTPVSRSAVSPSTPHIAKPPRVASLYAPIRKTPPPRALSIGTTNGGEDLPEQGTTRDARAVPAVPTHAQAAVPSAQDAPRVINPASTPPARPPRRPQVHRSRPSSSETMKASGKNAGMEPSPLRKSFVQSRD